MTDALFMGAHPDDVEILAGATVAKLVKTGYKVAVADATRGEMGTRGTKETRAEEANRAAEILGVERHNLGLPDGRLMEDIPGVARRVVEFLRELRPRPPRARKAVSSGRFRPAPPWLRGA